MGLLGALALPAWPEAAPPPASASPIAQPHPLPSTLDQWQDRANAGDYFDQIETLKIGSLIWSVFPVQVYVEPPPPGSVTPAAWTQLTQAALQAWQPYLPLALTAKPDLADIHIRAIAPPLKIIPQTAAPQGSRPKLVLERAKSAETRYQLYKKTYKSGQVQLIHRCQIDVNPRQSLDYLQTAVIHELGHALGIWGHSPNPQDTMYFAQMRQPQGISARDVNTLKRIYQQPTQLGWFLP